MTFVFEARRLPFGDALVSRVPHMEGSSGALMDDAQMSDLPVWKRRLLEPVMEVVQQHYGCSLGTPSSSETWALCCNVAMRIVEELPELEAAYNKIMEYRERQEKGMLTSEECMIEELLRERMGNDYLREASEDRETGDSASSISHSDDDNDAVDIAMCFDVDGDVLSIGSAGLFGGHGYHPHTHPKP